MFHSGNLAFHSHDFFYDPTRSKKGMAALAALKFQIFWMTIRGSQLLSFFTKISNCCVLYMLIQFVYRIVFFVIFFLRELVKQIDTMNPQFCGFCLSK